MDVFISYAHEDIGTARQIADALAREGLEVWWDHTIPPGRTWDEVIASAIRHARVSVVIWSPHSVGSDWVKEEASIALRGRKYLPVTIGGAEPPMGFSRIQAANLADWRGEARHPHWQLLLTAIREAPVPDARGDTPTQARPIHVSAAPAPRKSPPIAVLAVAGAALVALVLVSLYVMSGANNEHPTIEEAPAEATEAPGEVADAAAAPVADPGANRAEIERLQRERDAALEQARIAREQVAARPAPTDAPSASPAVGAWTGTLSWLGGTYTYGICADGTFREGRSTCDGDPSGRWRLNGSTLVLNYSSGYQWEFRGTVSGNSYSGLVWLPDGSAARYYEASSPQASFRMTRQ